MLRIKHTDRIKALEVKYWDAHHYLHVCMADPAATLTDRRECLAAVKTAFDDLVNASWTQYRKQHGQTWPVAEIRDVWKEYLTDMINARYSPLER